MISIPTHVRAFAREDNLLVSHRTVFIALSLEDRAVRILGVKSDAQLRQRDA